MMIYFIVYLICFAIEFLYIQQVKALVEDDIPKTMMWTGMLHVFGKGSTVIFVFNPYTIPFAVAGHVTGTFLGMWSKRRMKKKQG